MKRLIVILALLGCSAWAATCGKTVQGGSSSVDNNNLIAITACTPSVNSAVVDGKFFAGAGTANLIVGVWDSDGTGNGPKTVVCTSTPLPVVSPGTWVTLSFSGCNLLGGHLYWLGWTTDGNLTWYYDTISSRQIGSQAHTYDGTLVNFTSTTADPHEASAYVDLTPTSTNRHQVVITK